MRDLTAAIAAIDTDNEQDPNRVAGAARARLEGERAMHWVQVLAPDSPDELLLAARAHHIRRWSIPRSSYPDGRRGYLRWRRDLKEVHAEAVADKVGANGFDAAAVARVQDLVRKVGLGSDPETQVLEDAICLTFLEVQYEELAARLDDDHMVRVLEKTLAKMSPAGREAASSVAVSEHGQALLERASA